MKSLIMGLLLGYCCLWTATALHAAPVTFRFEAVVVQIEGNSDALNLPSSIYVGQTLGGQYFFGSEQELLDIFLHRELQKEGNVTLDISGMTVDSKTNFGTLNDGGPIDIGNPLPPSSNSSLSLGYISPTNVMPGWGGSVGVHPAGVSLALVGPDGTITQPDDVLEVQTWNQLKTPRSLTLQIGYPESVTIQATVGSFLSVPEPTSGWMLIGSLISGVAVMRGEGAFRRATKSNGVRNRFFSSAISPVRS